MVGVQNRITDSRWLAFRSLFGALFVALALAAQSGCSTGSLGSILNPGFVDLIDPGGVAGLDTVGASQGHVALAFFNNTEVDEALLSYLESAEGGSLQLTPAERNALRARVKFRMDVVFSNGNETSFEFIAGSSNLVEPAFDSLSVADLTRNDLDNGVVLCDVASVRLRRASFIDVFIPVEVTEYRSRDVLTGNLTTTVCELQRTIAPQFRQLQLDTFDNLEDLNITLRANIDPNFFSDTIIDPPCGSVVTITMSGVLAVPFLTRATFEQCTFPFPSYLDTDIEALAGIGGRFEFNVSVQTSPLFGGTVGP